MRPHSRCRPLTFCLRTFFGKKILILAPRFKRHFSGYASFPQRKAGSVVLVEYRGHLERCALHGYPARRPGKTLYTKKRGVPIVRGIATWVPKAVQCIFRILTRATFCSFRESRASMMHPTITLSGAQRVSSLFLESRIRRPLTF